jgi:hypothetical protein
MLGSPRAIAAGANSCIACSAAAVVVTLMLSSLANAADLGPPVKAVAPFPVYSWTGVYVGADVGYAWGHDGTTEYLTGTNVLTGLKWDYAPRGAVGGLFAGAATIRLAQWYWALRLILKWPGSTVGSMILPWVAPATPGLIGKGLCEVDLASQLNEPCSTERAAWHSPT